MAGAILVVEYIVFVLVTTRAGFSSLDAHALLSTATQRLQTGGFYYSRTPGHPLNEYWVLPGFVWLLQGGKVAEISNLTYALYLLTGGLACLAMFGLLLREMKVSPERGVLAAACLVFSPAYLIQSINGEEFLWSLAYLFAAAVLILRLSAGKVRSPVAGWGLAVAAAVAASGYRLEFGVVIMGLVGLCALLSDLSLWQKAGLGLWGIVLFLLLWAPLYYHQGLVPASDIHMGVVLKIEASLFKSAFELIGIIPMTLLVISFLLNLPHFRFLPTWGPALVNFLIPCLAVVFFPIYMLYPQKVQGVLPGLACLLALAALRANRWLWASIVVTSALTLLVQFDCYQHHTLTRLHAYPSLWSQEVSAKPAFQGAKIEAATRFANQGKNVVITRCWPWDFAWMQDHGAWNGTVESASGLAEDHEDFFRVGDGVVATRSVVDDPAVLKTYVDRGYTIWLDQDLYQEVFLRYTFSGHIPESFSIEGVPCRIVDLTQ